MFLLSWQIEGFPRIIHAIQYIQPIGWFALVYVSVLATVFGYGIWGLLLAHYPIGVVTPYALLVPIFGMLSSYIVFDEHFTNIQLFATLFILFGLIIN